MVPVGSVYSGVYVHCFVKFMSVGVNVDFSYVCLFGCTPTTQLV
jgi:hypothetical protein